MSDDRETTQNMFGLLLALESGSEDAVQILMPDDLDELQRLLMCALAQIVVLLNYDANVLTRKRTVRQIIESLALLAKAGDASA